MTEARGGHLYSTTHSLSSCKILLGAGGQEAVFEGSILEGNYQPVSSQCSSFSFLMYPSVMLWGHALGGEMSQAFKCQFRFIARMENENWKLYILIICV